MSTTNEWEVLKYGHVFIIVRWKLCNSLNFFIRRKKKYLWFRFPTDPTDFFCRPYYFFNAINRATLLSQGGCGLLMQRAKMASAVRECCHTNLIEPNCLNSSIGNMLLYLILMSGLYCKSPSKKLPKPWKKYFKKKFTSDLPPLIFSQYETGTKGIFLRLIWTMGNVSNQIGWMIMSYSGLAVWCVSSKIFCHLGWQKCFIQQLVNYTQMWVIITLQIAQTKASATVSASVALTPCLLVIIFAT